MTIIKITNVGDGCGALSVSYGGPVPTYGDVLQMDDGEYEVVDVKRYCTKCRRDAIRVDVTPLEGGQKVIS